MSLRLVIGLGVALALAGCTTSPGARSSTGKGSSPGATTSSSPSGHSSIPAGGGRPPLPPVELSAAHGETSIPRGLVVSGRFTSELVVDGGKLVVRPAATGSVPAVTLSMARALVAAAQSGEGDGWRAAQLIGFGVVTIETSLTKGLPSYTRRPAWVALVPSSPAVRFADAAVPQPSFEVIVLDASRGDDVLVYRTAGLALCGGPYSCTSALHGASVAAAEIVSVAWTASSQRPDPYNTGRFDWVVSYDLPRCGVVFDSPGVYWTRGEGGPVDLFVDVEEPLDPAPSCRPAHLAVSVFGPETTPLSQVGHAPLGVGISSPIPTIPAAPG